MPPGADITHRNEFTRYHPRQFSRNVKVTLLLGIFREYYVYSVLAGASNQLIKTVMLDA